jgi:hypothetical protein
MTDPAGRLSEEQLALMLRHMPIGLSVADTTDVVLFWAGAGFDTCHPKFIGRDPRDCHPKRARAALEALLADLKSGAKDEVDTVERGQHGPKRIISTALRDAGGRARLRPVDTGEASKESCRLPGGCHGHQEEVERAQRAQPHADRRHGSR